MTLTATILAAALALPQPWYAPGTGPGESPESYRARLETMAEAIALETRDPPAGWHRTDLAFAILAVWYEESRFALEVHAGTEHPVWTQDDGRARCLGQIHASGAIPEDQWRSLAGLSIDATRRCAAVTAWVIAAVARRCGYEPGPDRLALIFSAYGSGHCVSRTLKSGRAKAERFSALRRR